MALLPPATKLGQGYTFTGARDSVHRGGGDGCSRGGSAPGGGVCSRGLPGGDAPLGRRLLRAVRILLECILVEKLYFKHLTEDFQLILKEIQSG